MHSLFNEPCRIREILREMEDLHARTFRPIRDMLDRLPEPVDYDFPDLAEALAPRAAPAVTINIFVNQEPEQ